MPAVSPSRKAAFQILMAVQRGKSHSDDLLREKRVNALSPADRNLATALVLGVLRWQILLDHKIHLLLKRPNAKLDPEILIALRLAPSNCSIWTAFPPEPQSMRAWNWPSNPATASPPAWLTQCCGNSPLP